MGIRVLKIDDRWEDNAFVVVQSTSEACFTPLFHDALAANLFAMYYASPLSYRIEDYSDAREEEIAGKAAEFVRELFGEKRHLKVLGPDNPHWDESDYKDEDGNWLPGGEKDSELIRAKEFAHYDMVDAFEGQMSHHDKARMDWLFKKFGLFLNPPPVPIPVRDASGEIMQAMEISPPKKQD